MGGLSLEVLISCMNQTDMSLVSKSNITSDVLIINQCGRNAEMITEIRENQKIRRLDVNQRGLSNSRNTALENAKGDICLLCDDDEAMENGYDQCILNAFKEIPKADVIVFQISNQRSKLKDKIYKLSRLECLRVSSWQIAFRRNAVLNANVQFDPWLGAGTEQGCGEENKFLLDCMKCGLKIYHCPTVIASVKQEVSTWFHGYDSTFFYQRGKVTGYILGRPTAMLYAAYYACNKKSVYEKYCSFGEALCCMLKGIWSKESGKME